MRKLLTAMFLILLMQPGIAQTQEDTTSGSFYLRACNEMLKFDNGGEYVPFPVGLCTGFVLGSNGVYQIWEYVDGGAICIPKGASAGQLARVFVKYLDAHPEKLHNPAAILYYKAMLAAYPCASE